MTGYLGKASAPGNMFCRSRSRPPGPRALSLGVVNQEEITTLVKAPFFLVGRRKEHPRVPLPVVKCVEETMKRPTVTRAPPRSFQSWGAGAGVGGVEERDRQKGKDRDSQKDRERGDKPRGRISARARSKGRRLRGEGAGVETAWPHESDILRAFCSAKITRINPNFIHCVP